MICHICRKEIDFPPVISVFLFSEKSLCLDCYDPEEHGEVLCRSGYAVMMHMPIKTRFEILDL